MIDLQPFFELAAIEALYHGSQKGIRLPSKMLKRGRRAWLKMEPRSKLQFDLLKLLVEMGQIIDKRAAENDALMDRFEALHDAFDNRAN